MFCLYEIRRKSVATVRLLGPVPIARQVPEGEAAPVHIEELLGEQLSEYTLV